MSKQAERQKKILKWAIVVEIIICYMAVLTVVSYIRGPARYGLDDEPLLQTENFTSFAGQPAEPGGAFPVENEILGTAVGYQADIDLTTVKKVEISFQAECPEEYAGGTLFVDLYNGEAAYDSPDQEFHTVIQPGHNEAKFVLDSGTEHPDTALLRFFTLDRAGYSLESVQIYGYVPQPKVSAGLWIGVGACFLLLAGTLICRIMKGKK